MPARSIVLNRNKMVACDCLLELGFWHGGDPERGLALVLGHTGLFRGGPTSNFREGALPKVLIGSTGGLDLLEQLTAAPDRPRLDAISHFT